MIRFAFEVSTAMYRSMRCYALGGWDRRRLAVQSFLHAPRASSEKAHATLMLAGGVHLGHRGDWQRKFTKGAAPANLHTCQPLRVGYTKTLNRPAGFTQHASRNTESGIRHPE